MGMVDTELYNINYGTGGGDVSNISRLKSNRVN